MEEDHLKELRYLMYAGVAMLFLFIVVMGFVSSPNKEIAYDSCKNFCSISDKEVRVFEDGVCICKDK